MIGTRKTTSGQTEDDHAGITATTTTTAVDAGTDPTTTTIVTTTTTDSYAETPIDHNPEATAGAAKDSSQEPHSPTEHHGRFRRMLETFTHKQDTVTTTIHDQPQGDVTVDSLESTSVVTFSHPKDVPEDEETGASPDGGANFPGTINAKFVKEQSNQQNIAGLKHALSSSVEKSAPTKESGRLFDGGILTSSNVKKWYHDSIPIDWVHKFSREHHYGNYVITDRKTGAKTWEDMPIYARIGMHLLFTSSLDHQLLKTHKIHQLFSVESLNQGKHFDAPESVDHIASFIKTYKLDLSELLEQDLKQYKCFNEFFYRKLRPDARPICETENPNVIVSSADCRLCVFESISAATQVWIKGKAFSVEQLVQDAHLASQFEGGSIALFRLAPQDYHRFHSPVTGTIVGEPRKIDGTYYTVNPMAVNGNLNVFTENVREVTVIDLEQQETKNETFDQCVFISIGALLVGSIHLTGAGTPGNRVKKGEELGYFAYGGSTCLLLFKAGAVQFDEDLLANSLKGVETLVRVGERIGVRQG
ncbi:hypothetical protein BGX31_010264 [Mortierella sp. GBA43]|nr:hypothetical protein BGX31_010264 [Mortierella sp. GBA43]